MGYFLSFMAGGLFGFSIHACLVMAKRGDNQ